MADLQVSLVDPKYINRVWDEVEPILGKSIGSAHGRYEMKDIFKEIVNFQQHLWVVFDGRKIIAALTTSFTDYPKKKSIIRQFLGWRKNNAMARPHVENIRELGKRQ